MTHALDVTHIASVIASAPESSGTISTAPDAFGTVETRRELSGSEVSGLDYRDASKTAVGGARTLRSLLSLARAIYAGADVVLIDNVFSSISDPALAARVFERFCALSVSSEPPFPTFRTRTVLVAEGPGRYGLLEACDVLFVLAASRDSSCLVAEVLSSADKTSKPCTLHPHPTPKT